MHNIDITIEVCIPKIQIQNTCENQSYRQHSSLRGYVLSWSYMLYIKSLFHEYVELQSNLFLTDAIEQFYIYVDRHL